MPEDKINIKNFDLFKITGVLISGGSLYILAGSGITLFYFWSIGGIPIGQAGSAISMAKVVISSAFCVFLLMMTTWLIPAVASKIFLDEEFSTKIVGKYFSSKAGSQTEESQIDPFSAFCFSFITTGISTALVLLFLLFITHCIPKKSYEISWFIAFIIILAYNVCILCFCLKKCQSIEESSKKRWRWQWIGWGVLTSFCSIFPFTLLLRLFIKTDLILSTQSTWMVLLGGVGICLAITLAHAFSLWFLLQRNQRVAIRWLSVFTINSVILSFLVLCLGMSSRLLEAIMRLSSVRVENAVVVLSSDGCEVLASISATDWDRKNEKTCVLRDVTIHSTLEPAMQVAGCRKTDSDITHPVVFTIPTSYVKSISKIGGHPKLCED
ncbi:hypothetical protein AAHN93_10205 [Vandammella animalimorsus]|uniref:hypothetical protein n=1 Tax=Vandammella animalimorsus TaxID=2029117 RepID=UPI001178756C|nr:hypothetical protein [Vandammella animalimorsus]